MGLLPAFPLTPSTPAEAEELYQKRVLTITGICVALLVVGIVCVVAYCKTKGVVGIQANWGLLLWGQALFSTMPGLASPLLFPSAP